MSQIYCESTGVGLNAKRRVDGMKRLGQEIRAQIAANKGVEAAITDAVVQLCNNPDFTVYFTDPGGHTGAMREIPAPNPPGHGPRIEYENASGQWRKVLIKYHPDNDSQGAQIINIGAGQELTMAEYLTGMAEEAESLVKDPDWGINEPSVHNYFLATLNLRRCR